MTKDELTQVGAASISKLLRDWAGTNVVPLLSQDLEKAAGWIDGLAKENHELRQKLGEV